jgi:hypothetical protein
MECKHELPLSQCGPCLGLLASDGTWEKGPTFEALFAGKCADQSCHRRIDKYEPVTRWADGMEAVYTHEGCSP